MKRGNMRKRYWIMASWFLAFSTCFSATPPSNDTLVGTWGLVAARSTTSTGKVDPNAFGKHPSGILAFTAGGRMSMVVSDDGRKPLSVLDRVTAPVEERATAFSTFVAYAGRYEFKGGMLIYHVEVSSIQNWVNTDLKRFVTVNRTHLTIRTTPTQKGGVHETIELTFEKLD
jgi:hypothetical protein